jgi:hypothetical protein
MDDVSNPYASPQAAAPPDFAPSTLMKASVADYRSARGRANIATFLAAAYIVCAVLEIGSLVMQIQLLETAQTVGVDPAAAEANDTRHVFISMISLAAALGSLVALVVWIYRAYANLPALDANEIQFTPGWAVGWFFVPIMNLFRPYQVVRELWNESDPNRFTLSGQVLGEPASGAIVGWWWGLRIVSGVLGQVIFRMSGEAETIDGLLALSYVSIAAGALCDIPLHILQILLIRKTQRHQEQRYELVEKYRAFPMPGAAGANPFAEPA